MDIYSYHFKISLFFLYTILTIGIWLNHQKTAISEKENSYARGILVLSFLLFIVLFTRSLYFENVELNVDTSTWLSNVISLTYYPDKIWKWVVYTDSRPLTVLPLWITALLGIPINYSIAEFVGLLLWSGSILLTYLTFRLFIPPSLSLLLCWTLCLFIGTTNHDDYVAYNSEHVGIFLITLATFLYIRTAKNQSISQSKIFLLGLILGSLLFAKFQNIPMGLTITGFSLRLLIKLRKWRHIAFLVLGGVLPTFIVNLIFLFYGKIDDFWNNYFWNYFFYSYTTQFQSLPINLRFSPIRIIKFLLRSEQSRYYLIALFSTIAVGIGTSVNRVSSTFNKTNRSFAIMMIIASLYAILQSGSDFTHYILYIFIPLTYCIAAYSAEMPDLSKKLAFTFLLTLCCFQLYINCLQNIPSYANSIHQRPTSKKVVKAIKNHSTHQNNIVIWGWVDGWYYFSNRACGYRMPHSHQLFLKSKLYKSRINNFLSDLEENKPILFIDAVVPGWLPIEGIGKPHEFYPEVKAYIRKNYTLKEAIDNIRIYKRLGNKSKY